MALHYFAIDLDAYSAVTSVGVWYSKGKPSRSRNVMLPPYCNLTPTLRLSPLLLLASRGKAPIRKAVRALAKGRAKICISKYLTSTLGRCRILLYLPLLYAIIRNFQAIPSGISSPHHSAMEIRGKDRTHRRSLLLKA